MYQALKKFIQLNATTLLFMLAFDFVASFFVGFLVYLATGSFLWALIATTTVFDIKLITTQLDQIINRLNT
jgi:ABC-type polysaccharide/polyol phosphate export permease